MTTRSSPRDLFDDLLEILEDQFVNDERLMRHMLSEVGFTVVPTSTFDEVIAAVSGHKKFNELTAGTRKAVYEEVSYLI